MKPDFQKNKDGLLPVIVQEVSSLQVLMLAYMNEAAYLKTLAEQKVTFYSRSKQRLWTKGETSGNFLEVVSMTLDCDADTLLIKAKPQGNTCHLNQFSCFGAQAKQGFLHLLEDIIQKRRQDGSPTSYTHRLAASGINKVIQKVGEEAVEVVIAAKDPHQTNFQNEVADLLFHLLLLLHEKKTNLTEIEAVLWDRHQDK